MKKKLAFLLAVVLVFSMLPVTVLSAEGAHGSTCAAYDVGFVAAGIGAFSTTPPAVTVVNFNMVSESNITVPAGANVRIAAYVQIDLAVDSGLSPGAQVRAELVRDDGASRRGLLWGDSHSSVTTLTNLGINPEDPTDLFGDTWLVWGTVPVTQEHSGVHHIAIYIGGVRAGLSAPINLTVVSLDENVIKQTVMTFTYANLERVVTSMWVNGVV